MYASSGRVRSLVRPLVGIFLGQLSLFTIGLPSAAFFAGSGVVPDEQALTRRAEAVRATAVAVHLMRFTGVSFLCEVGGRVFVLQGGDQVGDVAVPVGAVLREILR